MAMKCGHNLRSIVLHRGTRRRGAAARCSIARQNIASRRPCRTARRDLARQLDYVGRKQRSLFERRTEHWADLL